MLIAGAGAAATFVGTVVLTARRNVRWPDGTCAVGSAPTTHVHTPRRLTPPESARAAAYAGQTQRAR